MEDLIYLSPNAEKPLTELDEQKIYVIGGLVDESVKKVIIRSYYRYNSFYLLILYSEYDLSGMSRQTYCLLQIAYRNLYGTFNLWWYIQSDSFS